MSSVIGGGNVSGEFVAGAPFIKFQNDWLRYSVNAETSYGMTTDRSVTAGGRLYANADPNPWTAYVGISKDLGSFRSFFTDQPQKNAKP